MDTSVERVLSRRAYLLDNKSVPARHETTSNLGTFLGETILSEMSPVAKEMMRIDKPFPVAPKMVWLSPADRYDGDLVLKAPPNVDVIKALTHDGILEIGTTAEKKLEEHWQARIKAAKKEVEDFERWANSIKVDKTFFNDPRQVRVQQSHQVCPTARKTGPRENPQTTTIGSFKNVPERSGRVD